MMTVPYLLDEPSRVDEPRGAEQYAVLLSQVASEHRPIIVRRNGEDLAAVVPLEHLELMREVLAWQEVEKLAGQIDRDSAVRRLRPPQAWFGDDDNPFEPEEPAP